MHSNICYFLRREFLKFLIRVEQKKIPNYNTTTTDTIKTVVFRQMIRDNYPIHEYVRLYVRVPSVIINNSLHLTRNIKKKVVFV